MIGVRRLYRKVDEFIPLRNLEQSWGDKLMKHNQRSWEFKIRWGI